MTVFTSSRGEMGQGLSRIYRLGSRFYTLTLALSRKERVFREARPALQYATSG